MSGQMEPTDLCSLRVGDEAPFWTGTWGEFATSNQDMEPEDVAATLLLVVLFGEAKIGGGASPEFTLKRLTLQPEPVLSAP